MLFSTILPRWPMNDSSYFFRLDRSKISSRCIKLLITRKKSIDFISKLTRKISKCCLSSPYSPCMGSIHRIRTIGREKRICIYPAVLISKISSSTKDDQPPIRRPNRPRSIILPTKRLGRVFSPSFSDFLLLSRSRFEIGRFIELMGLRRGPSRERKELNHYTFTIRFLCYLLYIYLLHIIVGEYITI